MSTDLKTPQIYSRDQHCISRSMLDEDALRIMYRIIRNGFKAYLVGGGVRDLLLNKIPKDYDIATDATPREIKRLFNNSRIIGRRFRLVQIYFKGGKIIQVSTFRDASDETEVHEVSGMPLSDNKYGTEATDAQRRDLTINALFYDLSTFSIIDYVGGMKDLNQKIIRVIGDPTLRFTEDPVRMLRVVRHASRAGFKIDPSCKNAIAEQKELLPNCSEMRIYEEFKKDLLSGSSHAILSRLYQHQLLTLFIPMISKEILQTDSELSQALLQIDTTVLAGKEISVVVPLTIIALFCCLPENELSGLASTDQNQQDLEDSILHCYSKLSVPKKEKIKICRLSQIIKELWCQDSPQINLAKIQRKRRTNDNGDQIISDLSNVLAVLGFDNKAQLLHANLEEQTLDERLEPSSTQDQAYRLNQRKRRRRNKNRN